MKEVAPSHRVVRFGGFEVDLRNGEVRKQGFKIKLQDQPFHVLQILLEHPGELVTREELQRQIWPADTFVDFEKGLNNAIKRLREALGDSAETPRFIETLPRRGYRFIAPVTSRNGSVGGQEITSSNERREPRRWFRWGAAMASVMGLAAATLIGLKALRVRDRGLAGTPVPRIQSLAVLPLVNLSGDPAQEYFSDGMTDALITDLAQISSVKVISRTSVMHYKKTDKTLPEIARELNVDGIVEGTVQRSGDRVRITAQLIHAASDKHLWAASYERDVQDVFRLERDVAGDVAHQVEARLTTQERPPMSQTRAVNPKALDAYLQGNYHLHRFGKGAGDEEKKEAAKCFQQAIDADPNFAPAFNGLANSHLFLLWPSKEDAAIVTRAAERAVDLDPNFADAHIALGRVRFKHDWDFPGAEEEFRRALALSPSNADAHSKLCEFLLSMNRMDEGLRECQIAQQIDPTGRHLPEALWAAGQYDCAIALTQMLLRSDPENGVLHHGLYLCYAAKGAYNEASQEEEKVSSLFGHREAAARIHRAFVASGPRAAIRQGAAEMEHMIVIKKAYFPGNIAAAYAILGDKDRAFYWLEEAYKHRDTASLNTDLHLSNLYENRVFDGLRTDPRYRDLARRIGLPP